MMGNDNILIVMVLAVVAYVVMTGTKAKAAVSSAVTAACPRGQRYSRGFFGDCDPNYTFGGWADQYCDCQSQVPSGTIAPQTPAPKPDPAIDYCPYDVNILAGDIRCVPERVYNYVPRIPTCPEGTYPTWYGGCEAGGGHL